MGAAEEQLWMKTAGGSWVQGNVELDDGKLKWSKDDDEVVFELPKVAAVKPIAFGTRKHIFEIDAKGKQVQFAALDEAAKSAWIEKLCKAAGLESPNATKATGRPARKSLGNRAMSNVRVAGLQSLLQGLPGGGSLGGGIMTQEEATKKLQEKLKGKVRIENEVSEEGCRVCKYLVNREDILKLPGRKGIVHKTCFYCSDCGDSLSEDAFRFDKAASKLFCLDHWTGSAESDAESVEEEKAAAAAADDDDNDDNDDKGDSKDEAEAKASPDPEAGVEASANGAEKTDAASRPSAAATGGMNHSAVMSRPTVRGRRRQSAGPGPRVPFSAANIPDVDKEEHFSCLHIESAKGARLLLFCDTIAEKRSWATALSSTVELVRLHAELEVAQRVDMFSAIQAQMNIENFQATHKVEQAGVVQVCVRKKAKDTNTKWRKAFASLGVDRKLVVYESREKAQDPKAKPFHAVDLAAKVVLRDGNTKAEITIAGPAVPVPVRANATAKTAPTPVGSPKRSSLNLSRNSKSRKSSTGSRKPSSRDSSPRSSASAGAGEEAVGPRLEAAASSSSTDLESDGDDYHEMLSRKAAAAADLERTAYCGSACALL